MVQNARFKKRVRARADAEGISYTAALRQIEAERKARETPDLSIQPTFEDDDYETCRCGYAPTNRQDLADHIENASRVDDREDHG